MRLREIKIKTQVISYYKKLVGVLIKKADAIIKDCKIHNLKLGGIHSWTEETNKVKILNNMVLIYN